MKMECSNCGWLGDEDQVIRRADRGPGDPPFAVSATVELCPRCRMDCVSEAETISPEVDRLEVYEKLVKIVRHVNTLREEFEAAKKAIDSGLSSAEGELKDLFLELADIDSRQFFEELDRRYEKTVDENSADWLLELIEERARK